MYKGIQVPFPSAVHNNVIKQVNCYTNWISNWEFKFLAQGRIFMALNANLSCTHNQIMTNWFFRAYDGLTLATAWIVDFIFGKIKGKWSEWGNMWTSEGKERAAEAKMVFSKCQGIVNEVEKWEPQRKGQISEASLRSHWDQSQKKI